MFNFFLVVMHVRAKTTHIYSTPFRLSLPRLFFAAYIPYNAPLGLDTRLWARTRFITSIEARYSSRIRDRKTRPLPLAPSSITDFHKFRTPREESPAVPSWLWWGPRRGNLVLIGSSCSTLLYQ